MEALREFATIIMGVEFGTNIDIALGAARRAKNFPTSVISGAPFIIAATINVVSMIFRKPSCSAK